MSSTVSNRAALPNIITAQADVVAPHAIPVLLAAANLLREEIILANVGTSSVRISSDPAMSSGVGFFVAPGETFRLKNTGAVYARNVTAVATIITVAESLYE